MLMLTGGLMALCRQVPAELWRWLLARFTVTATIKNSDPSFDYLVAWLDTLPYSKKARRVFVTVAKDRDDDCPVDNSVTEHKMPTFLFTPAEGKHVFWHLRNVIWLTRSIENTSGPGAGKFTLLDKHTIDLRCFGRSQQPIREIMQEAAKIAMAPRDDRIRVMIRGWDYWSEATRIKPRPVESVILPTGMWDRLSQDCQRFGESEVWYRNLGIPYRRGYLLEGVPGSGKSATVEALAGKLHMPLYIMNFSSGGLSDQVLCRLLSSIPPRSILLMEDIDAAFEERHRDKDSESGVTFSGLLNALDGVASAEGRLLFMTTNHVDKLDPALIRPGRCDVRLQYGVATRDQASRLYARFFPDATPPQNDAFTEQAIMQHHSMAELQAQLIERTTTQVAVASV